MLLTRDRFPLGSLPGRGAFFCPAAGDQGGGRQPRPRDVGNRFLRPFGGGRPVDHRLVVRRACVCVCVLFCPVTGTEIGTGTCT